MSAFDDVEEDTPCEEWLENLLEIEGSVPPLEKIGKHSINFIRTFFHSYGICLSDRGMKLF